MIIIVNYNLMALPVTFTWREDNSSSILKHGYEVGYNNGLCKQVFSCSKKVRALPLPCAVALTVVASVTGPKCEVAVLKTTRHLVGSRSIEDPWGAIVVDVTPGLSCQRNGEETKECEYEILFHLDFSYAEVLGLLAVEVLIIELNLAHLSLEVAVWNDGLGAANEPLLVVDAIEQDG